MVAMINNISSMESPVPGLTQDDADVPYCNENNKPLNCNNGTTCHCIHKVKLGLGKINDFWFYDAGGKNIFFHHNMKTLI